MNPNSPSPAGTHRFRRGLSLIPAVCGLLIGSGVSASAQTPYVLSQGDFSESFDSLSSWVTTTTGPFAGVATSMVGAIPDATRITVDSGSFQGSTSSSGIQKGAGNLIFLATGTGDSSNSVALDLFLDTTGVEVGNLSFDVAAIGNGVSDTSNRVSTLKVYASTDGTDWVEVEGATYVATNLKVGLTPPATIDVPLPETLNNSETARLRFYYFNGNGGSSGSRPKISVDNITVKQETGGVDLPPVLSAVTPLSPAAGAENVGLFDDLVLKFNEPVSAVDGKFIRIYVADSPTAIEEIEVTDWFSVDVNGSTATIMRSVPFTEGKDYYVTVDPGAFVDGTGNEFAGITATSGPGSWTFTSIPVDTFGPVPLTFTPAVNSATVPKGVPLTASVKFNELIQQIGTEGKITLHDGTTDALLETLEGTDLTTVSDRIDLAFSYLPAYGTLYKIKVEANTVTDELGNPNLPFEWTFSSKPEPESAPLLEEGYTQNFADFARDGGTPIFPLGWSITGGIVTFPTSGFDWGQGTSGGLRIGTVDDGKIFGFQHTGSTDVVQQILTLRNNTGSTINNLVVSYTGKVARSGEGRSPAYTVSVDGVVFPGLSYSTLSGVDAHIEAPVTGLNIPDGQVFQIVWSSERGEPSGASKQIGIADVSVSLGAGTFPPALAGPLNVLSDLSDHSITVNTGVSTDNGSAVTERGVLIAPTSVNAEPVIDGDGVIKVIDPEVGIGTFLTILGGLNPETSYSIRSYAKNGNGTAYTSVLTVTTLPAPPQFTGVYSQPFDNYEGVWPVGWSAVSLGGLQTFNASTAWSSTAFTGGFYGKESNPGLLGFLHTAATGDLEIELTLVNNTGAPITELYVGYLGRTGNVAGTRHPAWVVTLDGEVKEELAYSTAAGTDENIAATLTDLNIPVGARFTIKWVSNRGDGSGNSRKIGIGEVYVGLEPPAASEGFASWLDANDPGGSITGDHDGDGVPNGVEYFFGLTGSGFTPTPQLVNGKITWPDAGVTDLVYAVQTSTTLAEGSWVDVPAGDLDLAVPGFISYTPPASTPGAPKLFIRFLVETAPN